ncbi:MAG TPA: NADH-dependent [FeFe] hydrogenase, group A6 [Acidobacteriota bacterium]|nr:NADH-dependent [FeFe] hydrogenase, group A6 [Acidobacteriota bacterium]HQF88380.1 NADH-dependent [FeFe] hydrogenase, group A6 [Acidobacteriota bacterium]HQG92903.1 NADH-dependent [FeFe] hydrogenase, group A6 [Acidobacteriota bacterium]
MITLHANNRTIQAQEGETILSALKRAGIAVPTLCHMESLLPNGACRLCVVEVEGQRGLIPSCSYPVSDGMKIQTHSPRALRARKTIVELLLANHPDDCLYCHRNDSCRLRALAAELGVQQRRFGGTPVDHKVDLSSPSIIRDPAKCILCGKCVRVCEEIQGVSAINFINRGSKTVVGTAFNEGLNVSSCVNCGQCVMICPTGALVERNQADEIRAALADPERIAVIQHAPAVSVTLAEEFGLKPGQDVAGILNAALRRLGFKRVFDTSFSADLTIMEEASELAHRIRTGGPLPMFTSCSPAWVKFIEEFYPDLIDHVSTCKSPQQMLGAVIKSFYASRTGIDPARIYSVSVMPCLAKKFEASRPEMAPDGRPDIDAVITTRELAAMIRMQGIDFTSLEPEEADHPFGERSGAGKLFGATGGVMEAALRTAHFLLTGRELDPPKVTALRGLNGIKTATVRIGDLEVNVAVASGLANARQILDDIRSGERQLHFVEIMSCPGGCIAGGGQPYLTDPDRLRARMAALYEIDRQAPVQTSHRNEEVARLYEEFLGEPLGERSHELLHTHYHHRDVLQ